MPEFATTAGLAADLARFAAEARPGVVRTPRYRLRFVDWGDPARPPVVFVHGLCDRAGSFAPVMARLTAAGFRCVAYELADGRADDAVLGRYRHPDYAADLVVLLDHLGLGEVFAVGSSFGSTVVLRALIEHPRRFRRAAVQGGFARRPLAPVERALARLGRYWPGRMSDLPWRRAAMAKVDRPQFVGCPPEVFQFLVVNGGHTPIRAAALRGLLLDRLDLRPLLPAIRHPVLMVGGNADPVVPRRWEAELETGLKDVRRLELSPCGHYPQYTQPGPLSSAVADFFA